MLPTGVRPSHMRRFPKRCWISSLLNLRRARKELPQDLRASQPRSPKSCLTMRGFLISSSVLQLVAQASVPCDAARALGLGRMVALQKPNGRVRGIVVGDFTHRLVVRSFAQQKAEAFQEACSPFRLLCSRDLVRRVSFADSTLVSADRTAQSRESRLKLISTLARASRSLFSLCAPFIRLLKVGSVHSQ